MRYLTTIDLLDSECVRLQAQDMSFKSSNEEGGDECSVLALSPTKISRVQFGGLDDNDSSQLFEVPETESGALI